MSRQDSSDRAACLRFSNRLRARSFGLAVAFVLVVGTVAAGPQAQAGHAPRLSGQYAALQGVANDAHWGSSSTAPPTGRKQIRRGSAVLALGLLRAVTTVMHLVFSSPSRCGPQKRLDWSERSCRNLRIYGLAGVGLSAAFVVGGGVELGRGLWLRRRHQQWKRTHWHQFSSWAAQRGASGQGWHLGPTQW